MIEMELAEARDKLADLVEMAESGERVCIMKDGAPVAQILALGRRPGSYQPIDVEALRKFAATMPYQDESAGDFVRRMRDEDRY